MRVYANTLSWQPLAGFAGATLAQRRLEGILDSWLDTPYMMGAQVKGVGVDCVRFVCAVLDELYGYKRAPVPELPQDIALHKRDTAVAAMRFILRLYEPNESVDNGALEPGDVLAVAPPGGGPGHAMIVGARENEIWHSTGRRVQMTGLALYLGGWSIHSAYRTCDRERWVHGD